MFPGVRVRTKPVHACSPACMLAQGPCTHVLRRACPHKARARMFPGVHVRTRLVHACSSARVSAQPSCTHVLRHASQHEAHARMQSGVLACMPEIPARREFERYAEESFWPAPTQAGARTLLFQCCSIFSLTIASCGCTLRLLFWNNYGTTSIKPCTNAFTRQR